MAIKINIEGDGLRFEAETDLVSASQIIAFLGNANVQPSSQNSNMAVRVNLGTNTEVQKVSPREALATSGAKTNAEKITALGRYITRRDSVETFSAKEVREVLKKIGEPLPGNFSRDVKDAIRSNYIYEDDKLSDRYYITDFGSRSIDDGFIKAENRVTTSKYRKKKKGSNSTILKLREEVKSMEVTPNFEGFKEYWKLESKGIKIIWLIAFASKHNLDDLSAREIEYLASRLKDNISSSNVPALSKVNIKKGFITVTNNGNYRVLKPGLTIVENL